MSNNILDLEISYDAIEAPIFCGHKRGNNWAAVVTGKNAANATKHFLGRAGEEYDVELVKKGDVLEIAADYRTSGGNFQPERIFAVVVERTDVRMRLETYGSLAKAIKAGHEFRASLVPGAAIVIEASTVNTPAPVATAPAP